MDEMYFGRRAGITETGKLTGTAQPNRLTIPADGMITLEILEAERPTASELLERCQDAGFPQRASTKIYKEMTTFNIISMH